MAVANNMIASLLTPVENFQQRRQDRINEANFTSQITQNQLFQEERVRQERLLAEQQLAQLRSLNVEDEDRLKIDQFLSTFQEGIEKKIKKNYKSPMEYIRTEFNRDISLLKDALLTSDVYQNAIHNKTVMNAVRNDMKEGLVSMGSMSRTPDGKISVNTIESQLAEWRQGKRDRLDYMGSYKTPTKYYDELQSQYGQDRFTKEQVSPDAVLGAIQAYDGLDDKQAVYEFYRRSLDRTPLYYKYDDKYKLEEYQLDRAAKQSQIARNRSQAAAANASAQLSNAQLNALYKSGIDPIMEIPANIFADPKSKPFLSNGDPLVKISRGQYGTEFINELLGTTGFIAKDKDRGMVLSPSAKLGLATPGMNSYLKKLPGYLANQPVSINGIVSKVERDANGKPDLRSSKLYVSVDVAVDDRYRPAGFSNFDKVGTTRFIKGSKDTYFEKTQNETNNPLSAGRGDRHVLRNALIEVDPQLLQRMMLRQSLGNPTVGGANMTGSFPGAQGAPWIR